MDFDLSELIPPFLAETEEGLSAMEDALTRIESVDDDSELLATIFRTAHTLKGSAATVGLSTVAEVAHAVEDLLERLRDGSVAVTADRVSLLLSSVDALRQLVPRAAAGDKKLGTEDRELIARLELSAETGDEAEETGPLTMELDLRGLVTDGGEGSIPTVEVRRLAVDADGRRSLRVGLDKLDRLLNLTGEICIARGQTTRLLESGSRPRHVVLETHRQSDLLYMELQELVMKLRMVPVGPLFRKQIRTVRDLACTHGKRVRLEIDGQDVEVDTSVLEHLRDPLTHLVRNAFDHGIEPPEDRKRSGKEAIGIIRLRARHEGGNIVVEIEDDGAGLDRERIRRKAAERDIEGWRDLSSDELDDLIFEPGFSTAARVTELSGRGVGMDVVRRNIEALRGVVQVTSERGRGTTFSIRLPLTLAIIDGFYVGLDRDTYILPLDAVVETVAFDAGAAPTGGPRGILNLRGRALPYVRLGEVLGMARGAKSRESVVVVRHEERQYGLVVDELKGQAQAIIKPLPKVLQGIRGLSGSTILGAGEVAFILDVNTLLGDEVYGCLEGEPADERLGVKAPR